MNTAIWKYPLKISQPVNSLEIPQGGRILTAQFQRQRDRNGNIEDFGGEVVVWAHVDPNAKKSKRLIRIVTTGNDKLELDNNVEYIATVQIEGAIGTLVLHIFEIH